MRKLTTNTEYEYHPDGYAIIFCKLKSSGEWVKAFTCHASCIPMIISANSLSVENVVLKPYHKEGA